MDWFWMVFVMGSIVVFFGVVSCLFLFMWCVF